MSSDANAPPRAGRTVLVTGAGKRLGRALAIGFAGRGYAVAAHYNSSALGAEETVAAIASEGGRAAAFGADLGRTGAAEELFAAVSAEMGEPSALVNSAASFDPDGLTTLTEEGWRRTIDVNLAAPVALMAVFARRWRGRTPPEGAHVVNMVDVQLSAPAPGYFSYFCAKAGLATATRMAALDLAPTIRVNAVAPGLVLPSGGQTPEEFAARQELTPLGAGLGADDVVGAALYLDGALQVTGQTIVVDGGQALMGFGNAALSARAAP